MKNIAQSYREEARRLEALIKEARHRAKSTNDYSDKAKLRQLYEVHRDLLALADYLENYYERKYAYTKNQETLFDLHCLTKRDERRSGREVERFAVTSGHPDETSCCGDERVFDALAERGYCYVPVGHDASRDWRD